MAIFPIRAIRGLLQLGYPPRGVKTLVFGTSESLLKRLIYVLSYFVRCSVVKTREIRFQGPDLATLVQRIEPIEASGISKGGDSLVGNGERRYDVRSYSKKL